MVFEKFDSRDLGLFYDCINKGMPVEECPLKLTDKEKEVYNSELEWLKKERKDHPGVPITFQCTFELDW